MRMRIDKARRDDLAFGVNHLLGVAGDFAERSDLAVAHCNIAFKGWGAAAVADESVADNEIEHCFFPRLKGSGLTRLSALTPWRAAAG